MKSLVAQMLDGELVEAQESLNKRLESELPLKIHGEIYPIAQVALNPPFINPHMPKMYRICGGFYQSLGVEDAERLLRVEVNEYSRREKMKEVRRPEGPREAGSLKEAIRGGDVEETAAAMDTINRKNGSGALGAQLLRLGSGYLDGSLGHAVSCTSFILQELGDRGPSSCWPSISVLADYFCKGGYAEEDETGTVTEREETIGENILRAVSDTGIASLHDTLTIFAIAKSRPNLDDSTYFRLVGSWIRYLGDKRAEPFRVKRSSGEGRLEFGEFEDLFLAGDVEKLVTRASAMLTGEEGVALLSDYLLRGVIRNQGNRADPHVFTGLGSIRWVIGTHWDSPDVKPTALYQYLDYASRAMKR